MVDSFLDMWRANGVPFDVFLRDAPIMAHSIDQHGKLINVSTFWASRLGYEPHQMIGRPSIDYLTPESRIQAVERTLPEFRRTGRISNVRYQFQSADGGIVPVIMSAIALPNTANPTRSLAVMFDNGVARKLDEILTATDSVLSAYDKIKSDIPTANRAEFESAVMDLKSLGRT